MCGLENVLYWLGGILQVRARLQVRSSLERLALVGQVRPSKKGLAIVPLPCSGQRQSSTDNMKLSPTQYY